MTEDTGRAIVLTIGPAHDGPWWWEQLRRSPLRHSLIYERVSLGGKTHHQMSLWDSARLTWRFLKLLVRARRERIRYIFTFESDVSCYLIGILQLVPLLSGPRHVILQFISREKGAGLGAGIRDAIARACLRSVHLIVCSSRNEAEYYRRRFGWPQSKVAFAPFHTDQRFLREHSDAAASDYIIAAGRSYRDYATMAAAVAGTGLRTLIVCGRGGPGVSDLPSEVEVIRELPLAELIERMARARIIVLPLEHRRISTGQTVLLQAMALGRPVIATRTAGTEDYLEDGENGVLTPPGDAAALRTAILDLWHDEARAATLARAARRAVSRRHLPLHYAHQIARLLASSEMPRA